MISPKNWWLGFVPLAVLWVIANWTNTSVVERDLANRTGLAVSAQKSIGSIDQWSLDVAGRDVTIMGNSFSLDASKQIENTAQLTGGVRLANNSIKDIVEAKPYIWSATKDPSSLVMNGSVSLPEVRNTLIDRARMLLPGLDVRDQMNYALGAPVKFGHMTEIAIQALSNMSIGTASISDDNLLIKGTATSSSAYSSIMALSKTGSATEFGQINVRPPTAHPYVSTVKYDGKTITLTGSVGSLDLHDALLPSLKALFPQAKVIDHLSFADGYLPNFSVAVSRGILSLSRLVDGELSISDNIVTLIGHTPPGLDPQLAINQLVSNLPEAFSLSGLSSVVATIIPPVFTATKGDGVLTLNGFYPDEKAHQAIIEAVSQQFFAEKLVDNLTAGPVKLPNFEATITNSLRQLSRLASGTLIATDSFIQIKGNAFYLNAGVKILQNLKDLPIDPQFASVIGTEPTEAELPVSECQARLKSVLESGTIRFESAKATIDQDSGGILDVIVSSAMRCPSSSIEISGHTDSDGDEQANVDLSLRRAKAVADYFIDAGISAANLTAVGHGASQPVATNDTKEGKAKNRRIEFQVK